MLHTPSSFSRSSASQFILFKKASSLSIFATVLTAVVFVGDQCSKLFAFASEKMSDLTVIPWLFGFTHHKNYGIVANIPIPIGIIISATFIVSLIVFYLIIQSIRQGKVLRTIALALILAGAFGNLYDRMALGYVRDWILLFDSSVINLADISIFVGIVMLLYRGAGFAPSSSR